jgi:hypothetical protein
MFIKLGWRNVQPLSQLLKAQIHPAFFCQKFKGGRPKIIA